MSQRRKQYLKNQKRHKKLIIIVAIFLALVFGLSFAWLTWQKNLAKKSLESFLPDDLISLAILNINSDSEQNTKLTEIARHIGDEKLFKNYLSNLILQGITFEDLKIEEQAFLGWLGNEMAVGNVRVAKNRNSNIFVLKIKNEQILKNVLNTFVDNLEKKGFVVSKEEFRGKEITTVAKTKSFSFVIYDNFLLVAEYPDGMKKIIDVKQGQDRALIYDAKYKKAKNKLASQKGVVFVYGDALELVKVFLKSNFKLDEDILAKTADLGGQYYASAKLYVDEKNIKAKIYFPEIYKLSDNKKIKPKFADLAGEDAVVYLEGASLKPLLTSLIAGDSQDPQAQFALISRGAKLDYGIDLNEILDLLGGQYGVYLAPEFTGEKIRLALMVDLKNKDKATDELLKLDDKLAKLISKYVLNNEDAQFIERKYKDFSYKILKLPKKTFDLGYLVKDDKLIIFSNEKILENLSSADKLEQMASFQEFNKIKTEQLVYIGMDNLLKFADAFGSDDNASQNLAAKAIGAIRIIKNRSWSGNFIEAEIVVK